ncbi:unnamed protein product, partial [Mesorhabditis belari]
MIIEPEDDEQGSSRSREIHFIQEENEPTSPSSLKPSVEVSPLRKTSVSFALDFEAQHKAEEVDAENRANAYYDKNRPKKDEETIGMMNGRWIDNTNACNFLAALVSLLYALVLTVIAIIIEVSPGWSNQLYIGELVFYIWMYGFGLIFFGYCYFFLVYTKWFLQVQRWLIRLRILDDDKWVLEKAAHTGEGAGSLYLRLGAVVFGTLGIMLLGMESFLIFHNHDNGTQAAKLILVAVFIFVEMHFIFCNSKLVIITNQGIARFGMMHVIAVNIFTWIRFILVKAISKHTKKQKKELKTGYYADDSSDSSEEATAYESTIVYGQQIYEALTSTTPYPIKTNETSGNLGQTLYIEKYFGDFTTIFVTCIVEYSLIGAAVMFILWMQIGHVGPHHGWSQQKRAKRKSKMRIDCSRSTSGIFGGVLYMILVFMSIGVYLVFSKLNETSNQTLCFGIVEIVMYTWILSVLIFGLWRMRVLQYKRENSHASAEILDEILLVIGLFGEIVYCCIAIDLWIATQSSESKYQKMHGYDLALYIIRLVSVFLQALFIFLSTRLAARGPNEQRIKPGKQSVTFLLVANIALFIFMTFESMNSNLPLNASSSAFPYIIYGVGPLVVFYR